MRVEIAVEYADQLLHERTGRHLSDLQSYIIQQSWQGKTYGQVATLAGYSEGHVKDVAAQLWKLLSEALGERITKGNLRSRLKNRLKRTLKSAPGSATVIASLRSVQAQIDKRDTFGSIPVFPAHTAPLTPLSTAFLGRQTALQTLQTLAQTHRIIVIQGEGGVGKTTLAQQYCQRFDQTLELLMAKEAENITPVESVVEEWLRQHFNEEPGREFSVTLSRLKRHLQSRLQAGKVGILIDNLEPALDGNGQFIAGCRHYVELLRVLATAQATVLITSRDRLCEPGIKVHHYRLPGLTLEAWQQFFVAHSSVKGDHATDILTHMHRAYGGNAKAMEILCAAALEDFAGDLSAFWHENSVNLLGAADLRNLVGSQVNRLRQLDTNAYKVFCRLGCYRYQDHAQLKADAIAALMWGVAPAAQRQIIHSLRDRSLLECEKGRYWLHPVSRAEAIERLRTSADWQQANQAAADYWNAQPRSMVTVNDALQALEAYYHFIAIKDYDAAAAVLLKSRHNQWRQFLPLASSLYRIGLLQPAINAITQVLPHVQAGRSELNNILGDAYWITGDVRGAIACQQQTLLDTEETKEQQNSLNNFPKNFPTVQQSSAARNYYYLRMLTVDAHLSIGLYHIDLWELPQAAERFEQVIALAEGSAHQAWATKATVGLALVQAYLGQTRSAKALANRVAAQFTAVSDDEYGRYAYFLQLLGQSFGALRERETALVMYERAIASAEAGHYIQVKAKALTGLAILQRQRGDWEGAMSLHTQAIDLCEAIGATCDLAEAYFQMGRSAETQMGMRADCFGEAIALFTKIQAPQQIKRVQAAQH